MPEYPSNMALYLLIRSNMGTRHFFRHLHSSTADSLSTIFEERGWG